jgi:sugar phosphate isomerase/epimerase
MEPFEFAIEHGFDAFEWFPDRKPNGTGWSEEDIGGGQRKWIRDRAAESGISLSVHAPWQVSPLDPWSREILDRVILFARDIGATVLNMHLTDVDEIEKFTNAIIPIINNAADAGIRVSIENTVYASPEAFNRLFEMLDREAVGMCLDTGHANLNSRTPNDYLRYVDLLDPEVPIIHLHLHENFGDEDSHLTVFSGPSVDDDSGISGLLERLHKRGFSGSAILEQWPAPPDLLVRARDRLYDIWEQVSQGRGKKDKS